MRFIAGLRDFLGARAGPITRTQGPRVLSADTPCAICLEKVAPDGWSSEPVPTCRSCWPLLAWFRRLYIDSEDADVIETLSAETRFVEDISVDSLDYIEFLVEAEQTFGVTIPDRNAERLLTVGDFLRYIRDCLRNGDAKPISADTEKLWDRDLDR